LRYPVKKIILTAVFILLFLSKAQAAARYISLAPSTTEILFALGLNEEIVGISSYCNYPPAVKNKPRVGDFSHPSIEKILSLKADYIFCTGLEQAPVIRELRRLKLKVFVSDPSNIEELLNSISEIARITGKSREAAVLIDNMRRDIKAVTSKVSAIQQGKKAKVFVEIWRDPLMTAGRGSFIDELITLAGGINIAYDLTRPYSNYSAEKVVNANPDCIILAYMDREMPLKLVAGRFGWSDINAVRNKRVFNDINPDILLRPGPRITEGLREIYKRLYPKND